MIMEKIKSVWRVLVAVGLHVVACVLAICFLPYLYTQVLTEGEVGVKVDSALVSVIQEPLTNGVVLRNDSIFTRKYIDQQEKIVLSSLMGKSDSLYIRYIRSVEELSYLSNGGEKQSWTYLLLLTFCFVVLGCSGRTFFDYIGHTCYTKEGQDMKKWWPWYVFRLFMGVPITAFLLVASRCAIFSTLFTSRDLNVYLVIAFLAGFAMMEFMDMLRATAKGLFSKER